MKEGMPKAYAAAGATKGQHIAPEHDKLAQAAIAPITTGMVVGLGTGRSSTRVMRALALRVQQEHLDIKCIRKVVGLTCTLPPLLPLQRLILPMRPLAMPPSSRPCVMA